jgi:opacity protein-like surface antigen
MNNHGWFAIYLMAIIGLLGPNGAFADPNDNNDDVVGSRTGVSIGGRGMYFKPLDADKGSWSGGAQLRLHFTPTLAIEGSADYRQNLFAGSLVDIYPVQASLMFYLLPGLPISPYIIGGAGWYYTHWRQTDTTQNRFGPHAGAGLEIFLNHYWSIDGSWRYVWTSRINPPNTLNQNFRDRGSMVTGALNYHF